MKNDFTTLFITIIFIFSLSMMQGQAKMGTSITFVHSEKASFTSKMMQSMFSFFGLKKGGNLIKKGNKITIPGIKNS